MPDDHRALAGLDDVPWDTVEHAYGPATDVPELLRELTGTREQQEHALYELHGNIWHQGTVYEATAHAVPFVARLVLTQPAPLRDELLDLLADVATGSSYLDVHRDLVGDGLAVQEREAMQVELAHVAAGRAAVLGSLAPIVAKVMAEPTLGALVLITRLAAAYPDEQEPFTQPLQWMWENAEDVRVRAALGIALARRGDPADDADEILCDLFNSLHVEAQTGEAPGAGR